MSELYSREHLEGFFKWRMETALQHFADELDCEERAKAFALSHPRANGFITFKSTYKGKRFFWIARGESVEMQGMECFLKVRNVKYERAKRVIYKSVFKKIRR